jgi:hypothetical protein
MDMDAAIKHCTKGIGIWDWASTDEGAEPDVVLATAGDIPTLESLAASVMLREAFPKLKIRWSFPSRPLFIPQVFYQCPGLEDYVVAAEFFYECPGFEEYAIVDETTPAAVAAPAAQQR